jgi:CheY-like chemotaxis protein
MYKEPLVIVFDRMTSSRVRIMKIFESENIKVQDANNQMELLNVLSQNDDTKNILIMSIDDELTDDGLELIKKVKPIYPDLYVIILTTITRRDFFAKCISENIDDYILKPFEDDLLLERATRLVNHRENITESILKFNFQRYLRSEIVKAKKGNYPFTLLKSTIFAVGIEGYNRLGNEYARYASGIYEQLNELFWETDIFIQYGLDSFLGFFPFCGEENSILINNKVNKEFEAMKEANVNLQKYAIMNSFVYFPENGDDVDSMLQQLADNIEDKVSFNI